MVPLNNRCWPETYENYNDVLRIYSRTAQATAACTTIYIHSTAVMGIPATKPVYTKNEIMRDETKSRSRAVLGPKKARWK